MPVSVFDAEKVRGGEDERILLRLFPGAHLFTAPLLERALVRGQAARSSLRFGSSHS